MLKNILFALLAFALTAYACAKFPAKFNPMYIIGLKKLAPAIKSDVPVDFKKDTDNKQTLNQE